MNFCYYESKIVTFNMLFIVIYILYCLKRKLFAVKYFTSKINQSKIHKYMKVDCRRISKYIYCMYVYITIEI